MLLTGAPLGVTLAGVKVQVTPEGNPEQPRLIGSLNPPAGVSVIVRFDACPAVRFKVELLTAIV